MNKLYILTLTIDFITTLVITYFVFMVNKIPAEFFWTIMSLSFKPYATTSLFLISKTQKAKYINIMTKMMDEAIKIRDESEWKIELAAAKPARAPELIKSTRNVDLWNISNDKLGLLDKINELEKKINILEQQQKPAEVVK